MKKLLTLLFERVVPGGALRDNRWWWLHETTGEDPATERTGMFTYPEVLHAAKNKLVKVERNHATFATDTLPPHGGEGRPPAGKP